MNRTAFRGLMVRRIAAVGTVLVWFAVIGRAADACDDDVQDSESLIIGEVRVESRWNTFSSVAVPMKPGDVFKNADVSAAIQAVGAAIREENINTGANGSVQATFVDSCVRRLPDKKVSVVIRPWTIRLGIPIGLDERTQPRSARPVREDTLPVALQSVTPEFGVGFDDALDTTARMRFSTSAGRMMDAASHTRNSTRRNDLAIDMAGERSMKSDNYFVRGSVAFTHTTAGGKHRISAGTNLSAMRQPLGPVDTRFDNAMRNFVSYRIGGNGRWFRGAGFSGAQRWAGNRTDTLDTTEQAGEFRGAVDYRLPFGVGRTMLLADFGFPAAAQNYQRLVIRTAYSAEIPVIRSHTLGVEVQYSNGSSWGVVPNYARFFGGSDQNRMVLDDSLDTVFFRRFTTGPQFRGFGVAQAGPTGFGLLGGTGYHALNANIAIPLSFWSRFLIPKDLIDGGVSLGDRIERFGLNSSESALASYYELLEHLPSAEAVSRAKRDVDSIRPAVRFLTRYAKLYSLRPLVMMDYGTVSDAAFSRTVFTPGVGLQLTIVSAKFDVGRVWVVNRRMGDPAGNWVFRVSFFNLF